MPFFVDVDDLNAESNEKNNEGRAWLLDVAPGEQALWSWKSNPQCLWDLMDDTFGVDIGARREMHYNKARIC